MPEINPYEAPQTESKITKENKPAESKSGLILLSWIVPLSIGLQLLSGALWFAFDFMQAMSHSGYERLQTIAAFFAISGLILSVGLFILAIICFYLKLLLFEILILSIILWCTWPIVN
jgi:hypothetical protein